MIYKENYPKIKAYVTKNNGSEEDAEDVFQEGVIVFYENLRNGKFKGEASVNTYFYSICRNIWLSTFKKNRGGNEFLEEIHQMYELEGEEIVPNKEIIGRVFDELKEECKQLLVDFYYANKSIKELRERLGLNSDQAVKNKKGRCLKYLMNIVNKHQLTKESFYNVR